MTKAQRSGGSFSAFSRYLDAPWMQSEVAKQIRRRCLELLVFASLLPLIGRAVFPSDPAGLQAGLPWVMVPPLLFAARYGSTWGVACAAVTAVLVNIPLPFPGNVTGQHILPGVGLCLLCLAIGEFTSASHKRIARSDAENAFLRHRLELLNTNSAEQTPTAQFVADLGTALEFAKRGELTSVLLSMQFEPSRQGRNIAQFIGQSIRSVDSSVTLESSSKHETIGLVLPLMTEQAALAFRLRIDQAVREQFDVQLNHVMQDFQVKVVGARDDLTTCLKFFTVHVSADALNLTVPQQTLRRAA